MRNRPLHAPRAFYHVTMRGNARQAIFRDEEDRDTLEKCLTDASNYYGTEIHAYCWMTNHLHLLLRVSDEPVFKTVRHFASQYARLFNRKYQGVGHVFQGRHKRRHVATDAYLKQVTRYIHRNPLEAGLVEEPLAYMWSSYRAYLGRAKCQYLVTETVLDLFADHPAAARRALANFTTGSLSESHPWSTWQEIIEIAMSRFGVSEHELCGPARNRKLTEARCWVTRRAIQAKLGSITWVADRLGRSPSALARILNRRVDEE